jgi:hypothetical protein
MPKRKSVHVSRTINPLHFEDLEPHRFEDLIRQLAYDFRPWNRLEATGRLGADEGLDIRGIEGVTADPADFDSDDSEEGESVVTPINEREWRIQCKRYKSITPKLMRQIVAETVPDPKIPPYGLIVAAACDVSAKSMSAFHEERIKRGVAEGHLWVRAHLEDMLFTPRNDHLLFAYFGISLGTRRRGQLQQVRTIIATKRKLLRAFEVEELRDINFEDVIIRDISDSSYPRVYKFGPGHIFEVDPWMAGAVIQAYEFGLVVARYDFDGWIREDGAWDIIRDSASLSSRVRFDFYDRILYGQQETPLRHRLSEIYQEFVPKAERTTIRLVFTLPFEAILEVDPIGDIIYEASHLFCLYSGELGPFDQFNFYLSDNYSTQFLDPEKHALLFKELFSAHVAEEELRQVNFLVRH